MTTGIILTCIVVIICRLGYKHNLTKKILPLNIIDYLLLIIIVLVVLYFSFIHK